MAVLKEIPLNNNLVAHITDNPAGVCEIHEDGWSPSMFIRLSYVEYDGTGFKEEIGFKDISVDLHITGHVITSCMDTLINMISEAKRMRQHIMDNSKDKHLPFEPIINLFIEASESKDDEQSDKG